MITLSVGYFIALLILFALAADLMLSGILLITTGARPIGRFLVTHGTTAIFAFEAVLLSSLNAPEFRFAIIVLITWFILSFFIAPPPKITLIFGRLNPRRKTHEAPPPTSSVGKSPRYYPPSEDDDEDDYHDEHYDG